MKIAVLVVFALVACTKPPADVVEKPRPHTRSAPVRTDRTHYVLGEGPFGPETTIVTTFTAPADRPVSIVNCNGQINVGLQRLVRGAEGFSPPGKWDYAWSVEMNACLSEPVVIPAGGSRTETMIVASGADALVDSRTTERRIESGTYRAIWHGVLTSFDINARPFGEDLPLEQRVSAPITIERAPPPDPSQTSPRQRPAEITSIEPAHGSTATGRAPVRVRLDFARTGFRVAGSPRLYVDREDVTDRARISGTEDVPPSMLELEYVPPRAWTPGRHDIRVVYLRQQGRFSWYAWSFTVPQS